MVRKGLTIATLDGGICAKSASRQGFLHDIYGRYWQELCHYFMSRYGEGPPEPQEIVQEAFTHFAALQDPQSVDNPRAFLYRTAINIAIDHKRKVTRHHRLLAADSSFLGQDACDELSPERVTLGKDELQILEAAIMTLPERDRTFFLLNRLEDVSFAEIARRTGMSASGVRLIVERALETCQTAVRKSARKRAPYGGM